MCGRYASTRTRSELLETFKIEEALADEEKPPDYNVAPTKTPAVVLARPPRDDKDAEPVRQLRNLIWGLLPAQLHRTGPENPGTEGSDCCTIR
jgi:putative SOS response-associated peptidase YedK